jgi:hypothetical protein
VFFVFAFFLFEFGVEFGIEFGGDGGVGHFSPPVEFCEEFLELFWV